ncbi:unnamed protein product [Arctogadus glacialis]
MTCCILEGTNPQKNDLILQEDTFPEVNINMFTISLEENMNTRPAVSAARSSLGKFKCLLAPTYISVMREAISTVRS